MSRVEWKINNNKGEKRRMNKPSQSINPVRNNPIKKETKAMQKMLPIMLITTLALSGLVSCDKKDSITDNNDDNNNSGLVELSGNISQNTTWTANKSYLMIGQTFVDSGVTLTIEAGTTIKSQADDGNGLAPALVIKRGAKIMAAGTAAAPITFTSNLPAAELPQRGTWGGLIILGKAPINQAGGQSFVEGLVGVPFGGNNADDNSGVLTYVRIWFGGRSIGQDNEINGLTLGGVGRGTTIEHIEVAWNLDDGIEFFGGTVDIKYCSILFVGDDAFDTDLGYTGRGQFLFAMVGSDDGNRGFEMDNDGHNMDATPRSKPQFMNVTMVGSGAGAAADNDQLIRLREGTSADFRNMVLVNSKEYGVNITNQASLDLIGNDLNFSSNNFIYNCPSGQFKGDLGLTAQNVDPQLTAVNDHETGGVIDPRPASGSPALTAGETLPNDGFFTQVAYSGAFSDNIWFKDYSILKDMGRLPSN